MKLNHTLIFIHGFMGSSHSWNNIRTKITTPSKAIDIPGHGENCNLNSNKPYSFDDWNTDLLYELNQKKMNKVNLCGYSMGGRLALSFALAYPEKINSLILISTNSGIENNSEKQKRVNIDVKLINEIKTNYSSFVSKWEKLSFFNNQKKRNLLSFTQQKEIRLSQNPEQIAFSLEYLGQGKMPNYWIKLQSINFHVLIISGGEDKKYRDISKRLHSKIKNSQLEIIQNSGHAPQIDQQNYFIKTINNFMNNEN